MHRSVLVAMSGVVDSSVAAFLLGDAGCEVSGISMRLTGAVTSADVTPPRDRHAPLWIKHACGGEGNRPADPPSRIREGRIPGDMLHTRERLPRLLRELNRRAGGLADRSERPGHGENPVPPHGGGAIELRFGEPQWAVAPGQPVVFYQGDTVLGMGIITRGWRE
jgi:hypothetical protein